MRIVILWDLSIIHIETNEKIIYIQVEPKPFFPTRIYIRKL